MKVKLTRANLTTIVILRSGKEDKIHLCKHIFEATFQKYINRNKKQTQNNDGKC